MPLSEVEKVSLGRRWGPASKEFVLQARQGRHKPLLGRLLRALSGGGAFTIVARGTAEAREAVLLAVFASPSLSPILI